MGNEEEIARERMEKENGFSLFLSHQMKQESNENTTLLHINISYAMGLTKSKRWLFFVRDFILSKVSLSRSAQTEICIHMHGKCEKHKYAYRVFHMDYISA